MFYKINLKKTHLCLIKAFDVILTTIKRNVFLALTYLINFN